MKGIGFLVRFVDDEEVAEPLISMAPVVVVTTAVMEGALLLTAVNGVVTVASPSSLHRSNVATALTATSPLKHIQRSHRTSPFQSAFPLQGASPGDI